MQKLIEAVHELARDSRGDYNKDRLENIIGEAMALMMEHFWDDLEDYPLEADFDIEELEVTTGEKNDRRDH